MYIAIPRALPVAFLAHLLRYAKANGQAPLLLERFLTCASLDVVEGLKRIGLQVQAPAIPNVVPQSREFLVFVDSDKILHILLMVDSLEDYDPNLPCRSHDAPEVGDLVKKRLKTVTAELYERLKGRYNIQHLLLYQGFGRHGSWHVDCESLDIAPVALALPEFSALTILERGEPLCLWKFAQARARAWTGKEVFSFGHVYEYQAYRKQGHWFGPLETSIVKHLVFKPGGRGLVLQEAQRLDARRLVRSPDGNYLVEIIRFRPQEEEEPIFVQVGQADIRTTLAYVHNGLTIWVLGPPCELGSPQRQQSNGFGDCLTYWLWQCEPSLGEVYERLSRIHGGVTSIEFDFAETSPPDVVRPGEPPWVMCLDSKAGRLRVEMQSKAARFFEEADNRGERELVRALCLALAELAGHEAPSTLADEAIQRHAPLGLKKKLISPVLAYGPAMDPRGLPSFRPLQEGDISVAARRWQLHVIEKLHLESGPVPEHLQVRVLQEGVSFLFEEMRNRLSLLSSKDLLEVFLTLNEANIHTIALQRIYLVTGPLCYGTPDKLLTRMQQFEGPSMAARFLVELIAAEPPSGNQRLSLSSCDELMASAAELIRIAMHSDLLHYRLSSAVLKVVPGVGVAFTVPEYEKAWKQFEPLGQSGLLLEAKRTYEWSLPDGDGTEGNGWDEPFRSEFGYTYVDLMTLLTAAMELAADSAEKGILMMARPHVIDALCLATHLDRALVTHTLDSLTLGPRSRFLEPPRPYIREDVYPWRHNRALSLLRRPFVARRSNGEVQILWGHRHLFSSWIYLHNLCAAGRLKAATQPMKRLLSRMQNERGREFMESVAEDLRGIRNMKVHTRVRRIGRLTLKDDRGDMGDIDVLACDLSKKRLYVIECKCLTAARTPHEMASEVERLFLDSPGAPSTVSKHLRRVAWVREHLHEILEDLDLNGGGWTVEDRIVVDENLRTPLLAECKVDIVARWQLASTVGGA